ncbi:uncharacterized protein [Nerophis lumbriciformis]|uniref:uncharacterized protein isoform X2 n=1 Tax=Nerophis lumbriciformis TaxID=546530 RepID=UPI002AE0838F|nr:oocyte zinc finger protein XlCOF22-like isoform X2 [Nerophis lumbriciformis]
MIFLSTIVHASCHATMTQPPRRKVGRRGKILCFDGDEKNYLSWETKFVEHLGQLGLKATLLSEPHDNKDDVQKNEDVYAELIQVLDDKSLSLIMIEAEDDGRRALKILRQYYGESQEEIPSEKRELNSSVGQKEPEPRHFEEKWWEPLRGSDVQQVSAESQHAIPSRQQKWSSKVGQREPETPHIKEEEEEQQLQGLMEADDEDETQSYQLYHSQSEITGGAELLTQHITEDDGEQLHIKEEEKTDEDESQSSHCLHSRSETNRGAELITRHIVDGKLLHIKEEEEEQQLQRLTEADDEDGAHSSQLRHSQSEESGAAELLTRHITEGDGEHCEDINSEPDNIYAPLSDMDDMMSDSSESDHSDDITKPLESNKNSKANTRRRTNNKHFDCPECGKSFGRRSNLKTHMRTHTGEKPFACSFCAKGFSLKHHMIIHMRTHTGEKPFACAVCSKTFCSADHMKRHMLIHTREASHPCSACGKIFTCKKGMLLHMRTHSPEKLFTCSVCCKMFTRKQNMNKHMRSHFEEEKFVCTLCPKRFTNKTAVMIHTRTHSREKPFGCIVCNKRFTCHYNVSRHKCATVMEAART